MKRIFSALLALLLLAGCSERDWRTASREPAGIAPDPVVTPEAVVQVYAARAWSWRGWFAVHTWIAAKRSGESAYMVYEVVGWRQYRGQPVVSAVRDVPDRYWYGEKPKLLADRRGEGVDDLIAQVEEAVRTYPWPQTYRAFPGPNSNTFTAWVAEQVPGLELELPLTAIGKGYLEEVVGLADLWPFSREG